MAVAYLEIDLRLTPIDPWRDVGGCTNGFVSFEAFVDSPFGFMAYIPKKDFKEKEFLQIELSLKLMTYKLNGIPKSLLQRIGTANGKKIFHQ